MKDKSSRTHFHDLTEVEFAYILPTSMLVGEDVKSAVVVEYRKLGKGN